MSGASMSVILPVYNAGRYLDEAVRSVLAQTAGDFELIAVDDGSTDGSGAVLAGFAEADPRVRVISQENAGLVAALNRGIAVSRGEILMRMDADDLAEPDRFERQLAYLAEHPECVALGTAVLLIDPEGRALKVMSPPVDHEGIDAMGLSGTGAAIVHPAAAVRRSAVEAIGGYHLEYPHAEDVDFFLRLAEVGRVANLAEVGLRYRVHPNSIGYTRRVEQGMSARRAAEDAFRRRGRAVPEFSMIPVPDRSIGKCYRLWGWWALRGGKARTARYYARRAVRCEPLNRNGWKLLACSLRGR